MFEKNTAYAGWAAQFFGGFYESSYPVKVSVKPFLSKDPKKEAKDRQDPDQIIYDALLAVNAKNSACIKMKTLQSITNYVRYLFLVRDATECRDLALAALPAADAPPVSPPMVTIPKTPPPRKEFTMQNPCRQPGMNYRKYESFHFVPATTDYDVYGVISGEEKNIGSASEKYEFMLRFGICQHAH